MHFSLQYELVSLDIDKRSFEFEPKDLVMPESFVPVYFDAYISSQYKGNPFLINLLFKDPTSSNYYAYFFISKNDKFVNFDMPILEKAFKRIVEGPATYYQDPKRISLPIRYRYLLKNISRDNLTIKEGFVIEEIDMKPIQIKLKSELESGSIVTYTSKYEGCYEETNWCLLKVCCSFKRHINYPYRYELVSNRTLNEKSLRDSAANEDHAENRVVAEESTDNIDVKETPKKKRWYCCG
ncbi:hypothetical protein BdWA1_002872 [Babesia duncani]|uniref:Uncharacterized protein n=1 Tax=Babesia duncani TaxID=323732 RepID=A0AAD9PIA0_9APIC|nr:hypothetical protein BdWA1_002872 [Babesia duncani]